MRGPELLSSCDCNMQHIENSLMLKPFLHISSVHEINFKPPRVSPPLPHVPTIIFGSNLRFCCCFLWGRGFVLGFFGLFCFVFGFVVVYCFGVFLINMV